MDDWIGRLLFPGDFQLGQGVGGAAPPAEDFTQVVITASVFRLGFEGQTHLPLGLGQILVLLGEQAEEGVAVGNFLPGGQAGPGERRRSARVTFPHFLDGTLKF